MADYVCRKHRCPNEGLVVEVAGEIGKPPACPKCSAALEPCPPLPLIPVYDTEQV